MTSAIFCTSAIRSPAQLIQAVDGVIFEEKKLFPLQRLATILR